MFRYLLPGCILLLFSCSTPADNQVQDNSWALLPFTKADTINPVLTAGDAVFNCPVRKTLLAWENKDVFNPAAVLRNDTVYMLYRAEDTIGKYAGTSRIGLAWSTDGLHFTKYPTPVLYPDQDSSYRYEWEGGCEDPRVVQDEQGIYYMTYTAYDGDKARLLVASSADLLHWTKHGPAFGKASEGKYTNTWSKSGSIVSSYAGGTPVAVKINGKYWMYWGDTDIFLAVSDDLVLWQPVETADGKLQTVFGPRKGKFDSDLVEPGPPAMLTEKGIVLLYNSRNVPSKGDSSLAEGTYAASQVLLSPTDPGTVLQRMDTWFMKPEQPYEITGQVNHVCFIEGLVQLRGTWFLYYGTADSKIAVATHESAVHQH